MLLDNAPESFGSHLADLNLAGRYSEYSQFDSEFTYKLGADWRAMDTLRLRSTFSTSVRTPRSYRFRSGSANSGTANRGAGGAPWC